MTAKAVSGAINWGDSEPATDISEHSMMPGVGAPCSLSTVEITWDDVTPVVPVGKAAPEDRIIRQSILEYDETRNQLLDELMELESFLAQRHRELSKSGDLVSASIFETAPKSVQQQVFLRINGMPVLCLV